MPLTFRHDTLSPAESALLSWQFGVADEEQPFHAALWLAISRAWEQASRGDPAARQFLARIGSSAAFPEEVRLFEVFKGADSEAFWLDLLERAGLEDRRQQSVSPAQERRKSSRSGD